MCRLFGLAAGAQPVHATFWLLEAPDSLVAQSHREPDGTGLGCFDRDGHPHVFKQPVAAYEDREFASEARSVESRHVVAHVRYASTGAHTRANTHPFEQKGRLFAHNGVIEDLPTLESELGDYRDLVHGDSDSERFFALITKEIEARGGDVEGGIVAAARFAARRLPVFAINLILITDEGLWALRYPETHGLLSCEREAGGPAGVDRRSSTGTRVGLAERAEEDTVVIASERMDDADDWREFASGELLHVDENAKVTRTVAVTEEPAHRLTLADLQPDAAASQRAP